MLLICCDCTTAYSVGAPACPQCGSTNAVEQGSPEHEAMQAKSKTKRKNVTGAPDVAG